MTGVARLWRLWAALIALGFAGRLLYGYSVDELQHLHFAWNVGQGRLPYRDFFEHHPPLFHYLLAPFVRHQTEAGTALLILCRLVALGVLLSALAAFYFLMRRALSAEAACWGLGAWILTHPFRTLGFELRPDWLALAGLFGALSGLLASVRDEGKRLWFRALTAGLLGGIGVCLTQKTAFLLLGVALWMAGVCRFAPDRDSRRRRLRVLLLFLAGAALPILILVLLFLRQGAGVDLWQHVISINLRWAREVSWRSVAQESLMPGFGLFALACAYAARIGRRPDPHLARATPESLVAVVLLLGTAAFLTTPVPHGHAFLFLIAPWAAFLAVAAVTRYAEDPSEMRQDRWRLLGAFALCLAALRWYNLLLTAAVWGPLAWWGGWLLRRTEAARRLSRVFALLLAVGGVVYLLRLADSFRLCEGREQARFLAFVNAQTVPGEAVLQTWPIVAPFRPAPTYHGFAHDGVLRTLSAGALEREWLAAVQTGRSRLVAAHPAALRRWTPRLSLFLDSRGVLLAAGPPNMDRVQVYRGRP